MMTPAQVATLIPAWVRARTHILPALEHCGGTHTEEDVLAGLLVNAYQLWPGQRSAIVTEVRQYPRKKVLHFWLIGGDLDEVKSMEAPIIEYGKSIGCEAATGSGRRGWEKAMPHWKFQCVTIARDIGQ